MVLAPGEGSRQKLTDRILECRKPERILLLDSPLGQSVTCGSTLAVPLFKMS